MKDKKKNLPTSFGTLAKQSELSKYLREVHAYLMLTEQEEKDLFKRYRETADVEAAKKLVMSHLRLVAKIALEYRSAYQNVLDLLQEGNLGLLKAVKTYDPDKGARLGYYAQWWIKSYILKYIVDNFRLVKIGTTKTQKKLFYNLIREKEKIEAMGFAATPAVLSKQLGVGEKDIIEMEKRLTQSEYALEAPIGSKSGDESSAQLRDFLPAEEKPADEVLADEQSQNILENMFSEFSKNLNERELHIFQERLLAELPKTLQDIADEYGITKERVRQIESKMIKELKKYFEEKGLSLETIGQTHP